jgi:hypothetical protein
MPYKNIEDQRKAWRAYYHRHKNEEVSRTKLRKKDIRLWLQEIKKNLCCIRCPENHPACLDFHHRDANHKEISISTAISTQGWSIRRIKEEIAKCDVLCSNCHRKLHYEQTQTERQRPIR